MPNPSVSKVPYRPLLKSIDSFSDKESYLTLTISKNKLLTPRVRTKELTTTNRFLEKINRLNCIDAPLTSGRHLRRRTYGFFETSYSAASATRFVFQRERIRPW